MTDYEDNTTDISTDYDSDYLVSNSEDEEEGFNTEKLYIKDDFESVITLSNSSDIILNKKIQQIKQTIDTLLASSFTLEENIKIHSIYNFNLACLQNRNRFLQEYVLIIMFLEHIGICFSKNMLSLVFPKMLIIPKKRNFERIKEYITSKFVFTDFNQYLNNGNENNNLIKKIEKYSSGVIFYIKNRLLLYKDEEFSKMEQNELCDILMKNKNNPFVSDPKLLFIIEWLSGLVKNLLVYNMYNIYSNQPNIYFFNKKKSIDYHISFCLRIVICFLNMAETVNIDNKYITVFLLYTDKHGIIKQLLNNKMFQFILKEIITKFKKEETLKVFKRQFIQHIKSSFNASIE